MPDPNPPEHKNSEPPTPPAANIHERPEIKPLIEKAGADPQRRVPQGTMKTGGDVPGGGGTQPLELPEDGTQPAATPADDPDKR